MIHLGKKKPSETGRHKNSFQANADSYDRDKQIVFLAQT